MASIKLKRGAESSIHFLADGEPGWTTDTHKLFIGQGGTNYEVGGAGGTVTSVNVSGGTTGLTTSGGPITTSGTITLGGTLALANGGTGATDATTARGTLGLGDCATLDVGTGSGEVAAGDHTHTGVYQPLDATLTALAGVSTSANQIIYATGTDTFDTTPLTAFGRSILDDADATTARGTLGLGDSATRNVGTTAGTVAAGDHTHAGVYQPVNQLLSLLADSSISAGQIPQLIVTGTYPALIPRVAGRSLSDFAITLIDDADASTARTTLGLGTLATQNSNAVAITGGTLSGVGIAGGTITGTTISGIADLAIADGGTGSSTAAGARTNLGLGDSATKNVGTTSGTVAAGDHTHAGVYQPKDSTLDTLSGKTTAQLIDLTRPPGEILILGHDGTPPGNWLPCNGAAVSRTTYAALFAAVGTLWGAGNGSTTFNVPDLRRRTLVGSGGTSTGTLGNAVGSTGGTETHTLSVAEMPSHSHSGSGGGSLLQGGSGSAANLATGGGSYAFGATNAVGSGSPHNNLPPSAVVAYWIKY